MLAAAAQAVANNMYGPYSAPLTTSSSTTSNGSGMYIDHNMQYAQYLAPPQQYPASATFPNQHDASLNDQSGASSPGKLEVRLSGHARAVSLPASVVMQSTNSNQGETSETYILEQRMYGLGLETSE
jgi:hypothetical protein